MGGGARSSERWGTTGLGEYIFNGLFNYIQRKEVRQSRNTTLGTLFLMFCPPPTFLLQFSGTSFVQLTHPIMIQRAIRELLRFFWDLACSDGNRNPGIPKGIPLQMLRLPHKPPPQFPSPKPWYHWLIHALPPSHLYTTERSLPSYWSSTSP